MRPWFVLPLFLLGRPLQDPVPPTFGMWYWHTPFELSSSDQATLREMSIDTLYVRAGTFSTDGEHLKTILPQEWKSTLTDPGVVLTMNFDPGLVSHLSTLPIDGIAEEVAFGLKTAKRKAANVRIIGYQLDVDCPTRLLPRYADLLRRVRKRLDAPLSITALPTWLNSRDMNEVADAVDFVVPQFYENQTGQTLESIASVSDPAALARGLGKLRNFGFPFRAGLSAYGHALIYNSRGKLAGMYRGLSPEDALRHPSLQTEDNEMLGNEQKLVFRATSPDRNGRGLNARIAFVLPTAGALRTQLEVYRRNAPPNALGPILYRFPEPGESMALPIATQQAALDHKRAPCWLALTISAKSEPWDLVSPTNRHVRLPHVVTVRAKATGPGPSWVGNGSVRVLLRLDQTGIASVAPGDFDSVESGTIDEKGQFRKVSGIRANAVLLQRGSAIPGEIYRSGPIETLPDGARHIEAEWMVRSPDGNTMGRSDNITLGIDQ